MRKYLADLARLHLSRGHLRYTASSLAGECIISDIKGRTCTALDWAWLGYFITAAHVCLDLDGEDRSLKALVQV